MFGPMGWGDLTMIAVAMGLVVVKVALIAAVGFWIFGRTRWGRNLWSRRVSPDDDLTLQVTDQLRAMQGQLEDLHARVDFTERLLIEQRDQLHGLGLESPHESHLPTPI